jgi:putative oligomerization/nucleic acid binding protein
MRLKRHVLVLAIAPALATMLPGCGSKTKVTNDTTTTGQQLQDLDEAHKQGIITEEEYNKQRKKILKGD